MTSQVVLAAHQNGDTGLGHCTSSGDGDPTAAVRARIVLRFVRVRARSHLARYGPLCGVILHPAGHTRSPAMHNAAFRAARHRRRLPGLRRAAPGTPGGGRPAGARALGVRQLAVSMPHKVAVMDHLDEVDEPVARSIGAVNTVTRDARRPPGGHQHRLARRHEAPWRPTTQAGRGPTAVVLGAGGAARGVVVYGLLERGAKVTVLNRTLGAGAGRAGRAVSAPTGPAPWTQLSETDARRAREHHLRGPRERRRLPGGSPEALRADSRGDGQRSTSPRARACCATPRPPGRPHGGGQVDAGPPGGGAARACGPGARPRRSQVMAEAFDAA